MILDVHGVLMAESEDELARLRAGIDALADYLDSGEPVTRLGVWDRVAPLLEGEQ